MKILVTGSSGFIGFHLCSKLLKIKKDIFLFGVDNFSNSYKDKLYRDLAKNKNFKLIKIDLNKESHVRKLPNVDVIIHLAAINGTQNFYNNPLNVLKSSTIPTLNLLERYSKNKLTHFIYAGSSESYAGLSEQIKIKLPTKENVPLGIPNNFNPRWSYAISKIHGEVATVSGSLNKNNNYTVLRYHNIYGPRMGINHVIPDFINRVNSNIFSLYGSKNTRSFLYVEDAVDATIKCINNKKCFNKTINIGSQNEIKIIDLGKLILSIIGIKKKIVTYDAPPGSVMRRLPDTGLLKKITKWRETTSLEDGLKKTIDFYYKKK